VQKAISLAVGYTVFCGLGHAADLTVTGDGKAGSKMTVEFSQTPEKADHSWTITPQANVTATGMDGPKLSFSAPPGTYLVAGGWCGRAAVGECDYGYGATVVVISGCGGVEPPKVMPPDERATPNDLRRAIVRIQFGNAGCTAAILAEHAASSRRLLLTAHHCIAGQPRDGIAFMSDGSKVKLRVVVTDAEADLAVLQTIDPYPKWFGLKLHTGGQLVGDAVWHAGYGVDKPESVEKGTLAVNAGTDGKIQFNLSVSSGDSGGPIIHDKTGTILAAVCCTTAPGKFASVWGGGWQRARALVDKAKGVDSASEWTPLPMPSVISAKWHK
jgi:hypothetical protein